MHVNDLPEMIPETAQEKIELYQKLRKRSAEDLLKLLQD